MNRRVEEIKKALQDTMQSAGKTQLMRHLDGKTLTRSQAIYAKCCDCMGYYFDGRGDCKMKHCPLYPFIRYRSLT